MTDYKDSILLAVYYYSNYLLFIIFPTKLYYIFLINDEKIISKNDLILSKDLPMVSIIIYL